MTVAEYLTDKLTCPICRSPVSILKDYEKIDLWIAQCDGCDSEGPLRPSKTDTLTDWLILTGGPIPGKAVPPQQGLWYDTSDSLEVKWTGKVWEMQLAFTDFAGYFLRSWHRTAEIIRPWLESEMYSDTKKGG